MHIYSVSDPEFKSYGRVWDDVPSNLTAPLVEALAATPIPEGSKYVESASELEGVKGADKLGFLMFGGRPFQLGWCNGHNTKLNCLEYHRDSEFNLGTEDFILLLAKQDEIVDGKLDTARVKAFRVPAGVLVEVYGTTLHYAPCHTDPAKGFRVLIALPKGTNTDKPDLPVRGSDDAWLWACNKWLLAHPDSAEAAQGAVAALTGENLDIAAML